ncbi:Oidioi.mRNA.OKI2018_I69.chr1.g715.t1.cds [Oikopleura dioica]|uniref:Oidioi.mRNA.OKI2018_I69.chr1.g715.t1.cds n=1 Tax=Oikopleura dioica TaxID=34765 RepID=A0ABN7SPJ6_OIKDI|nr:Oidioi.mRNA.OKI2018_I69.chr1.g715.t1.cds [Oikopleura dioica]
MEGALKLNNMLADLIEDLGGKAYRIETVDGQVVVPEELKPKPEPQPEQKQEHEPTKEDPKPEPALEPAPEQAPEPAAEPILEEPNQEEPTKCQLNPAQEKSPEKPKEVPAPEEEAPEKAPEEPIPEKEVEVETCEKKAPEAPEEEKEVQENEEVNEEIKQAKEEGKKSREAAREKYGAGLKSAFQTIDQDGSGYATVDEITKAMIAKGEVSPGDREAEFSAALKTYISKLKYDKTRPGELNEEEFVKFWADLYAFFNKIDKDGDKQIEVIETVELLEARADRYGLTKDDIMKKVDFFYKNADYNKDGKISIIEFFISLPELEKLLLSKN